MSKRAIRGDERGLYVRTAVGNFRPDPAPNGYNHAYDTSQGDLRQGDTVTGTQVNGMPLLRLKDKDGRQVYWLHEDEIARWEKNRQMDASLNTKLAALGVTISPIVTLTKACERQMMERDELARRLCGAMMGWCSCRRNEVCPSALEELENFIAAHKLTNHPPAAIEQAIEKLTHGKR